MRTLNDYFIYGEIPDLSTAGQVYFAAPDNGRIIKVFSVINNAITAADATLTVKINGTAVTGGTITVTQSGSAAGDVDTCTPTAANSVVEGDNIEVETNGGSTTTCRTGICIVVRR